MTYFSIEEITMINDTKLIYVFWTCRDVQEAKKMVHELLDQRLIACASILPLVESIFRWEGKIEQNQETKVILKTVVEHFDSIQSYICKHCSYQVPEIMQIDIAQGNSSYISWIIQETSS